jgi:hypothetical protein
VHEDNVWHLDQYLASISPRRRNPKFSQKLKTIFPLIKMMVVKSASSQRREWKLKPMISVGIHLYEPVYTHTFLTVGNTHASGRHTTFFGSPVGGPQDESTKIVESIQKLVLGENAYVRASPRSIAFGEQREANCYDDPDLKLVLLQQSGEPWNEPWIETGHIDSDFHDSSSDEADETDSDEADETDSDDGGSDDLDPSDMETEENESRGVLPDPVFSNEPKTRKDRIVETWKSLSAIIPRRKEGSALYKLEIRCLLPDFDAV